jgi:hypothetical protein
MNANAPWQVGEWELPSDLAKIEQQWASIRGILEDPAFFEHSSHEVSAWSCGQHGGHVVMVLQTIADRIEGNLAEPDRNRDETPPDVAHRVLSAGSLHRGGATAPDDTRPESRSREDFLAMLPAAVEAWKGIGSRADEIDQCPARSPHFRLGYLSSGEWVRMCAVHTAHHLKIVRDIVGSGSAPR